jgi:hypothetical protein
MFMLDLFSWWYGSGWSGILSATHKRLQSLTEAFSTKALLRTLFSPWRRIVSYPGAGIDAKLRAIGDNLVSRCVGFTVRIFVLVAASVSFVFLCVLGLLELILWPLLPLLAIVLIVKGII